VNWPRIIAKRIAIVVLVGGLIAAAHLVLGNAHLFNQYYYRIIALCGIGVIMAVSLNLINGICGQFSLGHAGFMAVGAYVSAALIYYGGDAILHAMGMGPIIRAAELGNDVGYLGPMLLVAIGIVAGGVAAGIVGLVVGIPTLRLRGDYLAIATLGVAEIIRVAVLNIEQVGGPRGMSLPTFVGFPWIAAVVVITILAIRNLMQSAHGRALLAVREDEVAAEATGVPTTRYKVTAFVLGSAMAGVAGVLFAFYEGLVVPDTFDFLHSVIYVVMVVAGGMGSMTGAVIAGVALTALPEVLRPVKDLRMVLFPLLLIILMLWRPQGMLGKREFTLRSLLPVWRGKRGGSNGGRP
jgi:branched-chain amino acid transport system permease protein